MPKVSVVIPCFNLGKYIHEAIDSVLAQTFQDFEIIVVNDGSTDTETNLILNDLKGDEIKVITTANQGLSSARNNGIAQAAGDYILPLDADDKIAPTYLEKAVKILDQNQNAGIVYCQAEFFGEENFKWDLPEYKLSTMLIDNMIFCSAFFRKKDWRLADGYKTDMIYGWEDYDFWLSIIELGRDVFRIPEYLFHYRKRSDSMINAMTREQLYYSYKKMVKNHKNLYADNIEHIFECIYSSRDTITILNAEISDLKAQLSDSSRLLRLLFKSILKKNASKINFK